MEQDQPFMGQPPITLDQINECDQIRYLLVSRRGRPPSRTVREHISECSSCGQHEGGTALLGRIRVGGTIAPSAYHSILQAQVPKDFLAPADANIHVLADLDRRVWHLWDVETCIFLWDLVERTAAATPLPETIQFAPLGAHAANLDPNLLGVRSYNALKRGGYIDGSHRLDSATPHDLLQIPLFEVRELTDLLRAIDDS